MTFDRFFALATPIRGLPLFLRYLIASAIILVFFGVRSAFAAAMGGYPFLLFFPAVILISLLLDRGTGVFSVLLSAGLAAYFFMPPPGSFRLHDPSSLVPLGLYVVVGVFLAIVIEALRSTAERLQRAKAELERAAELNRLLLVDVNHRVKNHLQSVTTLLRLSKRDIADPAAHEAIDVAAARIDVLGKVYNRLHLGQRTTVVSARDFLVSLVDDLRASIIGQRPIALRGHIVDAELTSAQAVPLGLVANELVENALKHAFPDDRAGQVELRFEKRGKLYCLSVRDDGAGRSSDLRPGGGTRLTRSLAQQLGGSIEYPPQPAGTLAELSFPLEIPNFRT